MEALLLAILLAILFPRFMRWLIGLAILITFLAAMVPH